MIPRIVILGGGFGGLAAAKALAGAPVEVTLVDRRNYHLFQPLLYQVATAALSPSDIAQPIRAILGAQANLKVLLGRVADIDRATRTVVLDDGRRLPFDRLVVATGARHAYFGHEEWEPWAPGLKKIDDATRIRARLLTAFERAEMEGNPDERARLLTFVVVGAGPTGVELAGAVAELARESLRGQFRTADPTQARIVLLDAAPRVLPSFPEALSAEAARALGALGVELRLGQAVSTCDADGVGFGNHRIEARTVLWAAGVAASPAARWLGAERDRAGRVVVTDRLTLPDDEHIFVIGDTAQIAGAPLPGVAPVARQQGIHVARRIKAGHDIGPFRYRNWGALATVGRHAAIADFGRLRLSGFPAWLIWGVVHVLFLLGFKNRLSVSLAWAWTWATHQRSARLITGAE